MPATRVNPMRRRPRRLLAIVAATLLLTPLTGAGAAAGELVAPYVPTTREDVERMLELAGVGPGDYLIDLGSGDGRIVITAAQRGAMGHGVELDRELVALAAERARAAEVQDRVTFRHEDIFATDLAPATVVTLYLMPEVNLRLRPRLLAELRPGTRVVSNSFDMGDWQPDRHVPGRASGGLMLWVVPAPVQGRWTLSLHGAGGRAGSADPAVLELAVEQHFQQLDVSLSRNGHLLHVSQPTLTGDRIAFLAGDGEHGYAFSGGVSGDAMAGAVQIHGVDGTRLATWRAVRASR
jgi:hypothetical protein